MDLEERLIPAFEKEYKSELKQFKNEFNDIIKQLTGKEDKEDIKYLEKKMDKHIKKEQYEKANKVKRKITKLSKK
jgi:excinuclease UvrABC nuclease subunit